MKKLEIAVRYMNIISIIMMGICVVIDALIHDMPAAIFHLLMMYVMYRICIEKSFDDECDD